VSGGGDSAGPLSVPTLRVAVAQAVAVSADPVANAARAASLVRAAGARVVVLPELFLSGYDVTALAADPALDLEGADDVRLDPIRAACADAGVAAVVCASLRTGGRRTIAVLVVGGDGSVSHAYDKQHLWSDEREVFQAGTHGAVVTVDGWPLGLGVCYDGCFPEHARAAAAAGAWAYLAPAAFVVGSEHRRDLYYASRALDNGMYVAMAGLTGRCGPDVFSGGSAVYDPEGRRLAGVVDGEGTAVVELDASVVHRTREEHPTLPDRPADLGRTVRQQVA